MREVDGLMLFDAYTLALHVVIVALASLGQVQWLKNYVDCPNENGKRKRKFARIGLIACLINVFFQMPFLPSWLIWGWNLMALSIAIMQFGHTALVKVPEKMINRAFGGGGQQSHGNIHHNLN